MDSEPEPARRVPTNKQSNAHDQEIGIESTISGKPQIAAHLADACNM
jgi:hypothetical protein